MQAVDTTHSPDYKYKLSIHPVQAAKLSPSVQSPLLQVLWQVVQILSALITKILFI